MGLLDDAIREHLELKRRRGADASEVARQEKEALEPAFPPHDDEPSVPEPDRAQAADDPAHETVGAPEYENPQAQRPVDLSPSGQETAEIDMRSVLAAGDEPAAPGTHATPASAARGAGADDEGAFDWETPEGQDHEPPPAEIPGQERLTFE